MATSASLKEQRDYAWSYFQLHANQRISSFNFFVVIAALLTTGLAGTLKMDFEYHYLGVILALSLIVISFIFWKMDQRVRFLIKHAEEALKSIEKEWMSNADFIGPELALFRGEEEKTKSVRSPGSWNPVQWHLLYSECFSAVYLVFGALGTIGGIAAVVKWVV
jgi:hypothetical protein